MSQTVAVTHQKTLRRMYRNILLMILVMIVFGSSTAAFLSYKSEKNLTLTKAEIMLNNVLSEFQMIEENFWSVYMPIFETPDAYDVLYQFFVVDKNSDLTPMAKKNMARVTKQIASRNSKIAWVAIYSPLRSENYIYYVNGDYLEELSEDFPFQKDLSAKKEQMEIYGARTIPDQLLGQRTFAICGGIPAEMGKGSILVGFISDIFTQLLSGSPSGTRYVISTPVDVVFDSAKEYSVPYTQTGQSVNRESGQWVYTRSIVQTRGYTVSYLLPWWNLFKNANRNTPVIFAIGAALIFVALLFYLLFTTSILRQVGKITTGLEKLGDNNLDYRLPEDQDFGEFQGISHAINQMAVNLQVMIDNEYLYLLKEKEAELAELQAKFDPHFLYNSLEVIRGRVYETGDVETANVIKKLSQIFRSLIDKKRFVTIQDELAFCNSYFSLIQSSSGDKIKLIYDVDSSLLYCGIIRNLLQPVIENYFVHGFDMHSSDNQICIRGVQEGETHICIQIIDNGLGISDDRLQKLSDEIEDEQDNPKKSYGLKNLTKRIQLFYGDDCGLDVKNNVDRGVCVTLRIRMMSCEQHENYFRSRIQSDRTKIIF